MYHLEKKAVKRICIFAALALLACLFAGCAAKKGQKAEKADKAPDQPQIQEKVVESIAVSQSDEFTEVLIKGNKKLTYTSIKQSFPFGIAVYLPGAKLGDQVSSIVPQEGGISNIISSYADKEEQTVKVEILLNRDLSYEIKEADAEKSLRVLIAKEGIEEIIRSAELDEEAPAPEKETETSEETVTEQKKQPSFGKPADLTGIQFDTADGGRSDIVIETTRPVNYSFSEPMQGTLNLHLHKTDIPEWHQRPLETKYFKSAVARVQPMLPPGGEDAVIKITMREQVPYHVVQNENRLVVSFEPSSIEPPKFAEAEKQAVSKPGQSGDGPAAPGMEGAETPGQQAEAATPDRKAAEQNEYEMLTGEKKYTGEKIKLDFFETDIKNVFRILGSISGKNFAVDKDVTGNVTLTLDKPVPWDQVLDLVLKMNNLGRTAEGNVIRIATHDTLKREKDRLHAEMEAIKKAKEQQKSLEPLVTEYIPINYADANADIRPHLEKIKTPDRGTITVDKRTNMIIITDTREKIDQAKEAIYRLDKVTPQIMIKAKVIEATEDFSKQFGFDWSMGQSDVYRDDLGGTYGWDMAMNHPVESASSIGYTFSRITGTPFTLNATLTASETKGDVKIISSPHIITLDNKPATIKQGIEVAYQTVEDGEVNIEFKEINLELEVTPHVTPDDRIRMTLTIKKEDITEITETGEPAISTNEANTELLVDNNDTVVIGGIVKKTITNTESGFPLLKDIPVIGSLFGSDIDTEGKKELMIFISPKIIQLKQKRMNSGQNSSQF